MDPTAEARRLRTALLAFRPDDDEEARHLASLLAFLASADAPFARATPGGHVTASCFVVDGDDTLLLHHAKLGRWLQPGGHVEPDLDADLEAATLREVREETGLAGDEVRLAPGPFDLDVHPIPARGGEPAHLHYDVRRLAVRVGGRARPDPRESRGLAWVALREVAGWDDPSLARMARKALAADGR